MIPVPKTFVPVGTVLPYAGRLATTDVSADAAGTAAMAQIRTNLSIAGWLYCDGSSVSTTQYCDLFGTIGHAFGGSGDSFNLPDLRGQFIRGVSDNVSQDPDRAARLSKTRTGYMAWMVGSTQADAFQAHEHDYKTWQGAGAAVTDPGDPVALFKPELGVRTTSCVATPEGATPRTSTETRPVNLYLNYIIRYRAEPPDIVPWGFGLP
ncbi:MAG TPA: phage tail protein [Telluria sp.]|nr:phage tail protein [Telluria sp.]